MGIVSVIPEGLAGVQNPLTHVLCIDGGALMGIGVFGLIAALVVMLIALNEVS